jgi:tetratricopeptide (TPR) repeat protein
LPNPIPAVAGNPELSREQAIALNEARDQGRALFQQRKYREAAEAFRRAAAIDSTEAPTYFNIGLCYQGLGNSQEAVQALRRAITIDGKFGPARLEIAKVLLAENQIESAEQEYEATRRLLADSLQYLVAAEQGLQRVAVAYTNRAVLAMRQRKNDDAAADAGRAIAIAPNLSRPYYIAGRLDEARENLASAIERYHQALEKAEDGKQRAEAAEGIGRVLMAMASEADRSNQQAEAARARREAVDHLRQSVSYDSTNATAFVNLGNALYELNENEEARAALVRAEELRPRDYRVPFKLAEVYLKLEQCQEAETAAARAIELQPANASVRAAHAEALECLGRLREAISEYEQARRDPRWRQRAEYKIKRLREQLGIPQEG